MDDEGILALLNSRDEKAITELGLSFGAYCKKVAVNILSSREDAEECFSDACHAVWNTVPPKQPKSLGAYIGTLTRNIALDRLDYSLAKKRGGNICCALDELSECVASFRDTAAEFDCAETARLITAFLRGEKPLSRSIFLRRYWFCESIEQIALSCGITQSKVKSVLFRQRNRLRFFLEENGITV